MFGQNTSNHKDRGQQEHLNKENDEDWLCGIWEENRFLSSSRK